MLSSPVYTEAHPRRSAVHAPSLHRACGWRIHPSSNLFRMNTCKSVSKQKTLSIFRINTYAKHRGWGQLLLTRHPLKGVCPERPSGVKDLSSSARRHVYPERRELLSRPLLTSLLPCPAPLQSLGFRQGEE